MTKRNWYTLWAMAYTFCAALSFIPDPEGVLSGFLVLLSLVFFLPPVMLLRWAIPAERWETVRVVRNFSLASLGATFVLLVLSFLSVAAPQWVGNVLHVLLVLASVPMVSMQAWAVSLFLWACLLMVTLKYRKRK